MQLAEGRVAARSSEAIEGKGRSPELIVVVAAFLGVDVHCERVDDKAIGGQDGRLQENRCASVECASCCHHRGVIVQGGWVGGLCGCGCGVELFHKGRGRLLADTLASLVRRGAPTASGGGSTKVELISHLILDSEELVFALWLVFGFEIALLVLGCRRDAGQRALLAGR